MNRRQDRFGIFPTNKRGKDNPCYQCGLMTTGLHHVVPVSKGGDKVIPLCVDCHNLVHEGMIMGELIRTGIAKSKAKGKAWGAPRKATTEVKAKALLLRSSGMFLRDIAKELNLAVGTIHNILK